MRYGGITTGVRGIWGQEQEQEQEQEGRARKQAGHQSGQRRGRGFRFTGGLKATGRSQGMAGRASIRSEKRRRIQIYRWLKGYREISGDGAGRASIRSEKGRRIQIYRWLKATGEGEGRAGIQSGVKRNL